MKETFEYLKKLEVNYIATLDNDKPSCRPFGDPVWFDDKIYILTNKGKNVYKQIKHNNKVCIVAYDGETWIRINCLLVDDSNNMLAKQAIIDEFDWAVGAGYTLDNPNFAILYIKDAEATIYNDTEQIEKHTF